MPAHAEAAVAAVTPGTTSKSMPRGAHRLDLLGEATEHGRVAALESHDRPWRRAIATSSPLMTACGRPCVRAPCPTSMTSGAGPRLGEQLAGDQSVVDDHRGLRGAGATP